MPSTSRLPSALTAVATTTLTWAMRPSSRTRWVSASSQRRPPRPLLRRRRLLGLRPPREAALRLPDRGRRRRRGRARAEPRRGVPQHGAEPGQQQQPARHLVRWRRHVHRRYERRQGLHLQRARRHRRAPRLAHPERRRHRRVLAEPRGVRGRCGRGRGGDDRHRRGDAAPRGCRHRPARCRCGGGRPPGCPGEPHRDHGDGDLGGRQPHARLPCRVRGGGAGGGLPAGRRGGGLQHPHLRRGRQRRLGRLRGGSPRHGALRARGRGLRLLRPGGAGVREQVLPRAVRGGRPGRDALHRPERRTGHGRSGCRRAEGARGRVPAGRDRRGIQPRAVRGRQRRQP